MFFSSSSGTIALGPISWMPAAASPRSWYALMNLVASGPSGVEPVHGLRLVAPDTLEERHVVGRAQRRANGADDLAAAFLEALDERVLRVDARRVVAHDRGHARQPVGRGPLAQVIAVLPRGEGHAHEEWRQARRARRAARHHDVGDAGFGGQRRNGADVRRPLAAGQDLHALAHDQLARQPLRDIGRRAGFVALDQLEVDARREDRSDEASGTVRRLDRWPRRSTRRAPSR